MNILKVIQRHGMTAEKVATQMGITKGALSQRMNVNYPTMNTLKAIADILGCRIGEFFEDEVMEQKSKQPDLTTIGKNGEKHYYVEVFPHE